MQALPLPLWEWVEGRGAYGTVPLSLSPSLKGRGEDSSPLPFIASFRTGWPPAGGRLAMTGESIRNSLRNTIGQCAIGSIVIGLAQATTMPAMLHSEPQPL